MSEEHSGMEKVVKTFCGICENTCGMQVTVNDGVVQRVEGLPEHPLSKGDLCIKGRESKNILYASDRLISPIKKVEGQWKPISWDEALQIIADKLDGLRETYGAHSLAVYHGQTYVSHALETFCMKRFLNLYGTPNLCSAASECFVPHAISGISTIGGLAKSDVEHSNCIMIWGANPFASGSLFGGNMVRFIRTLSGLKRKGVKFILVDPRTPDVSKVADLHLKVWPGTDGALALGMLRVIIERGLYDKEYVEKYTSGFDQLQEMVKGYDLEKVEKITGVSIHEIETAAHTFAENKPASLILGTGVEHHTNTVQTIRAITLLLAITGNIDVKGGNTFIAPPMLSSTSVEGITKTSVAPIGMEEHPLFVGVMNQAHALVLIEKILSNEESPVKALIVAGGAPIPELANTNKVREALKKIKFLVVIDLFMTETSEYADIVLPAAFFLERDEIGAVPLNLQNKAVDGKECWPDWKIWRELANKMGYGKYFPWQSFEEIADFLLKPTGMTCEELKKHPEGILNDVPPGRFLTGGFRTPSKKIELYSRFLESKGYDPLPGYKYPEESIYTSPELVREYPLTLTTGGRVSMYLHSQFRNIQQLRNLMPEPHLEIHPQTALEYGIQDGDAVIVESKRGKLSIRVKVTEDILPQVLHIPHGWREADCNLLTDHVKRDPISGFPGLKSSLCRIYKHKQ